MTATEDRSQSFTLSRFRLELVREAEMPYEPIRCREPLSVARFLFAEVVARLGREVMGAVFLDTRHNAIGYTVAYVGTLTRAQVELEDSSSWSRTSTPSLGCRRSPDNPATLTTHPDTHHSIRSTSRVFAVFPGEVVRARTQYHPPTSPPRRGAAPGSVFGTQASSVGVAGGRPTACSGRRSPPPLKLRAAKCPDRCGSLRSASEPDLP